MPGPKRGFTTPHRCATVDSLRRNQPSTRDRKARQKLQEKASDFQVTFDDNVYLSLGTEAKQDIYNTFDPNKPFDIHLDLPSTEWPPLVKIKQKGKPSIYTMDFLHLWMLYTSQAPILDLTGEQIRTKEDIEAAFHVLNLCSQEEEEQKSDGRKERRASQSK